MLKRRLYLRIYLALVGSLALSAVLIAILWRFAFDGSPLRGEFVALATEIAVALLPSPNATAQDSQASLDRWHQRVHANLALYNASRELIASSGDRPPTLDAARSESTWIHDARGPPAFLLKLPDGRWLWAQPLHWTHRPPLGFIAALALVAITLAAFAYPVARRLTRRLESLQTTVEAVGAGDLSARVAIAGHDEVARLARSFNHSAERIEALVKSHKTLLANASHELRSPLARLRLGLESIQGSASEAIRTEMTRDIAELDQLIDEILLASRLDSDSRAQEPFEQVDLTGLLAEECARVHAEFNGDLANVQGDAKLLRRMIRNLLENARRYGDNSTIEVSLRKTPRNEVEVSVSDRGPGIPESEREKIFEPFYRLRGAKEKDGSVGLGLSLVKQIAQHHGGSVTCETRSGGGSRFIVILRAVARED